MRLVDYDLITRGSISKGCTRDDGGTMGREYVHEYIHHIDKQHSRLYAVIRTVYIWYCYYCYYWVAAYNMILITGKLCRDKHVMINKALAELWGGGGRFEFS